MMETEHSSDEIQFKPINEGLGFHPFSDGLPYAPSTKKPTQVGTVRRDELPTPRGASMGAGAVAAGAPRFVTSVPKIHVPVASPAKGHQSILTSTVTAKKSEPQGIASTRLEWHYPLVRIAAYFLDTVLNTVLACAFLAAIFYREGYSFSAVLTPEVLLVISFFVLGLSWALITAQEIAFGTSFGKKVFGLGIKGSALQILWRAVCFIPSLFFLGIGVFWGILDRNKRCWHDLASRTQPVYITQL